MHALFTLPVSELKDIISTYEFTLGLNPVKNILTRMKEFDQRHKDRECHHDERLTNWKA